ncbi:anti-sigma factor domain-containing protein [Alicyclobacillus fodiniaquatilis]|jgi:hypothetical protein|uniref:Anti-sigma factor domain-containing protein n=1 Tax=Alicyclobacillus fodiniaquatilis TaxID=1661150 RepID=A0ABW4JKQ4_9BACL
MHRAKPHGMVMEIEGKRAIVMTNDGQFRRIRLREATEVGAFVPLRSLPSSSWHLRATVASVAAVVVILVGVLHAVLIAPPEVEAYAYVSLDINPSVSLDLSPHLTVLRADGLNAHGKSLLRSIHVRGKSLDKAISMIVGQTVKTGLLPQNDTIIVAAASATDGKDVTQIEQEATSDVDQALVVAPTNIAASATVYGMDLSDDVWKKAISQNVSPGKFATYLMAKQVGVNIKLADINSSNLQMLLTQVHDLQSGMAQLDTGSYGKVAEILQQYSPNQTTGNSNQQQHAAG